MNVTRNDLDGEDYINYISEQRTIRFHETLPQYNATYESEQEIRQTRLKENYRSVTVHVAREDFLHIQADVHIQFLQSAAQAAWAPFLSEVRQKLNIDFIDSIYDKFDHSPVHCTLRLQNDGHYVVRQREESSVLEVIQSGVRPGKIVWPITKDINSSKEILVDINNNLMPMEERVDKLISEPQVRSRQRGISVLLLKAKLPDEILKVVHELVEVKSEPAGVSDQELAELRKENAKKTDPEMDVVSLYRLSLECLNRIALKGFMEEMAEDSVVRYVLDTVERLRDEVDVVFIGMKLISDIVKILTRRTDRILHVIMDSIQHYGPPPACGDTRVLKRLIPSPEEQARLRAEEEERAQAELKAKEEQDMLELDARISAKEKAAQAEALEAVTTQVKLPKIKVSKAAKRQKKALKKMQARMAQGSVDRLSQSADTHSSSAFLTENESTSRVGHSATVNTIRSGPPRARVVAALPKPRTLVGAAEGSPGLPPRPVFKAPASTRRPLKSQGPMVVKKIEKKPSMWESFGGGDVVLDDDEIDRGDLKPLPVVDGVMFRGIAGNSRRNLALTQCVMTLFQFLNTHYANREVAYDMFIHEEMCDIGLVCTHMPRIVSYILWTVNKLLSDKQEEAENRAHAVISRKKAMSSRHDESESNLSIGSDYENKSDALEVEKVVANMTRPSDRVLLFFAVCVHLHDLEARDIALASKWLDKWDDKSRAYSSIRKRGLEMSNL